MTKFKFFALLVSVKSSSRNTPPKCLSPINAAGAKAFGDLQYILTELEPCLDLIIKNDAQSIIDTPSTDCTTVPDGQDSSKSVITCTTNDESKDCPSAPDECDIITSVRGPGTCVYSCKHNSIQCPNEKDLKFPFELKVDEDSSWCFDNSYSSCVIIKKDYENNNQERQSCTYNPCGFMETDLFTLSFTETGIINEYKTADGSKAENIFECDKITKTTPSGCLCTFDDTADVTVMECKEESYGDLCTDSDCEVVDAEKNDSVCYKGTPLMKYDSIICDVPDNENEDILYCKRGEKAYLPCGNLLHNCYGSTDGKSYTCECTDFDTTNKCPVKVENDLCVIEEIALAQPMDSCTKRVCFDDKFVKQASCPTDFAAIMWQCYDDFEFVNIANNSTTHNFDAKKKDGSFDDLSSCLEPKCIEGNCMCGDTEEEKAENHCGEFYLSQKNLVTTKNNNDDLQTSNTVEFQCYSYNKTLKAINDVNKDVNRASECKELKAPAESENAECPGPCNSKLLSFGFYDCQCDKKCSYDCASSKYDPIYNKTKPNDWDDNTDGNYYVGYTCEKDNLVMIICTSIFVPLGVAGIAAGVYFFFFHESSEVAPVETDNELASTRSTEQNRVEEDKEETQSEIAKKN